MNLKPCPFCGNEDIRFKNDFDYYAQWNFFIECSPCNLRMEADGDVKDGPPGARVEWVCRPEYVEAWNRRI